jgi:hypothetical protein
LREHVEDPRQHDLGNADAGVLHLETGLAVLLTDSDVDAAAALGVLDRVGQEVREHLGEARDVAVDMDRPLGHREMDHEPGLVDRGAHGLDRVEREPGQRDALLPELDLALADAREVEQVVDQPDHLPELPLPSCRAASACGPSRTTVRICRQLRIGASGLRSSCANVARARPCGGRHP